MSSNSAIERATYDMSQCPVLAYLGPAGTYSHQVYHTPVHRLRAHAISSYRPHTIDSPRPCITIPEIPSQVCTITTSAEEKNPVLINGCYEQTCFIMSVLPGT